MANLGNVGLCFGVPGLLSGFGIFGSSAPNTAVDITATSEIPGSLAVIDRNGVQVARAYTDPVTGVWHFYNLDDSGSQGYTIVTMTQAGGATGEVWIASVTGGVATVTKLFSASRATATAFA